MQIYFTITEFFPPSPSSTDGTAGSTSHVSPLIIKRYSYRPSGRGRTMLQSPLLSGPARRFFVVSHRLKLPLTATLFAAGAWRENRIPPSTGSGPRCTAAHPVKKRTRTATKAFSKIQIMEHILFLSSAIFKPNWRCPPAFPCRKFGHTRSAYHAMIILSPLLRKLICPEANQSYELVAERSFCLLFRSSARLEPP